MHPLNLTAEQDYGARRLLYRLIHDHEDRGDHLGALALKLAGEAILGPDPVDDDESVFPRAAEARVAA